MRALATGSNGLIGSEAVPRVEREGDRVFGAIDNLRRACLDRQGDTRWVFEVFPCKARRNDPLNFNIIDRSKSQEHSPERRSTVSLVQFLERVARGGPG